MTAMAMSPQYAVLLLLQTEPGIDSVLNFGGPVRFEHLPLIADAVLEHPGAVRFGDPDRSPPERQALRAARDALRWLDYPQDAPLPDDNATVQVVERARWAEGMAQAVVRDQPFPAERIVAGVITTPDEDRLLVVPTGGGAVTRDAVLLYARHRAPGETGWVLVPFAKRPGTQGQTEMSESCQLSDDPRLGCVSNGCQGRCIMETAYENRILVELGCVCH